MTLSAPEWEDLGKLADPQGSGVFDYEAFVRRCQLRVLACDARHQSGGGRHMTAASRQPRLRAPTEREASRRWGSARSAVHVNN